MIQYKRHKNRFFFKTRSILFGCGPSLSVCQSRISLYIFFWLGGIWKLTFTSHCLLEVGWTWAIYVCLYRANFREPVCLGHPHLVQPQIVSETVWFCGFWNGLNTHELCSWAIRFSHSGWFFYRSRQQRDLRHVVSCVYWMIVSSLQKWFPTNLSLVLYPVIYKALYVPSGAFFHPSSVW